MMTVHRMTVVGLGCVVTFLCGAALTAGVGDVRVADAAMRGDVAVVRSLLQQGADVNAAAENPQRVTPAHAAAAMCDRETMRMLLERGADPNARLAAKAVEAA